MADIAFDDQVDITDKVCPLTFVKAKVAIEELDLSLIHISEPTRPY